MTFTQRPEEQYQAIYANNEHYGVMMMSRKQKPKPEAQKNDHDDALC
jgi:hypothetical protein